MGRLFWKFFTLFWLAQIAATFIVGVAMWIEHSHFNEHGRFTLEGPHYPPPPPPPSGFEPFDPNHPPKFDDRPPPPPPPHERGILHLPMLPILAGGFVSVLFAALLAWYFAKPIRHLRSAIHSFSKGALTTRISDEMSKRNDELNDLGKDFDFMANRIEELIESKHRLLHDVSHELRSPLARIQAAADLIQQQPQRTEEFIDRVRRDTQVIDKLVGELLTLARVDSSIEVNDREVIDLNELLGSITDDAQIESSAKNISIDFRPVDNLFVNGSTHLLCRAFENVLRNAIRHSPNQSTITVSLTKSKNFAIVSIADQGDGVKGIPTSDIFEPFVRASNVDPESGHGLGLAITKRVIESHHGWVSAVNRSGAGLTVSIALPNDIGV